MPSSAEWLVFLGTAALVAIMPGPGILYVLARSLHGGRADGIRSVVGNGLGACVHVVAAAFGLSAVLATSATAFMIVKLAGAAYLVYLGVRALFGKDEPPAAETSAVRKGTGRSVLLQGAVAEMLNPKTALFFLALLPHFVHPERDPAPLVFTVLGLIAVVLMVLVDILVAFFAGYVGTKLRRNPKWWSRQRIGSGLTMIGLGGLLAFAEQN